MRIIFETDNYNCKKVNIACNTCNHNFNLNAPSGSDICILYSTEVAEFCYACVYGETGVKTFIDRKIKEGMTMDQIYSYFNKPSAGRFELNSKLRCEKCNSSDTKVIDVVESNIMPELKWLEYNKR